ncbi:MAG TPA: Uma2 family endonuclease [Solirubrobacteraceae bacterium]|nr:Uma2 family endonuclease [Solirubrobacteraceae bacterium]
MATVAHPRLESPEYLALQARAGWRLDVELIDGEAVVMPPTGGWAASAQGKLYLALSRWQEQTEDGGLLLQDVFVTMPKGQYLAPDIAWWSASRRPPLSKGAIESVPDLVVEVLSPATRANDLGVKRDLYLDSGVSELWLADPDSRTITCLRASSEGSVAIGEVGMLESDLLDGFALDLADLF